MDKQKHKLYMAQILTMVFKDKELCNLLGFKGGTALMFFHDLPRFSTDLDFNLLDESKLDIVYEKVRNILTRFGSIDDEAKKFFGPVMVLDYGKGERMLKVEISARQYDNHYERQSGDLYETITDYHVGDLATGNVNAQMFGVLNLTETTMTYDVYTVNDDTVKLFDSLDVLKA